MKLFKNFAVLLFLSAFVLSSFKPTNNVTLSGVVSDKSTAKPLPGIYVYTVKGEEEVLTNERGEFTIVTWQKLPVVLHVRDLEKEYVQVKVTRASEKILIKL